MPDGVGAQFRRSGRFLAHCSREKLLPFTDLLHLERDSSFLAGPSGTDFSSSFMSSARQARFESSALAPPPVLSGTSLKKAVKKASRMPGKAGPRGPAGVRRQETPMRAEYDFSGSVRGKYAKRFTAGSNVASAFPTARAVNAALRSTLEQPRAKHGAGSKRRTG